MKDHSCEYPYILNDGRPCLTRAYQSHSGCEAWLCPEHLRNHDCERVKSWLVGSAALNAVPSLDPGKSMETMRDFAEKDETNVLFDVADFATMSEAWELMDRDLDKMPGYVAAQLEVSSIWESLHKDIPFGDLIDWERPTEAVGLETMGLFLTLYFSQLRATEYVSSG